MSGENFMSFNTSAANIKDQLAELKNQPEDAQSEYAMALLAQATIDASATIELLSGEEQ